MYRADNNPPQTRLDEANLRTTLSVSSTFICTDTIIQTLLATSSASWSAVNRTYAFFFPSGLRAPYQPRFQSQLHIGAHRMSVLIFAVCTSYNFFTASLI